MAAKNNKEWIKTFNAGSPDNPSRIMLEEYCKRSGKQEFSKMIRKAVFVYLSADPIHKDYKIKALIAERNQLLAKIRTLVEKRRFIEQKLRDYGLSDEDMEMIGNA